MERSPWALKLFTNPNQKMYFPSVFFREIPWLSLCFLAQPSLTLPALKEVFFLPCFSVFVRVSASVFPCFSVKLRGYASASFRVFPCPSVANASAYAFATLKTEPFRIYTLIKIGGMGKILCFFLLAPSFYLIIFIYVFLCFIWCLLCTDNPLDS